MNLPDNPSPTPPADATARAALRQRAEWQLATAALPPDAAPEVQRLVQELQVYQIELEMQNEELLQAQAAAEDSRRQYVDLYDFAPVGYCTLTPDGTISQLNLRTGHLLGQERRRLLGRRLALFVDPAERHQFAEFVARLWAYPGQRQSCELTMRRADDTHFFAQLEGVAPAEDDGAALPPTCCRLVLLDVTARRQATDALAANEARFRATFEQARDGMVLLDGLRLSDLNAAALHLLGAASKSLVLGRSLLEFWPEHQPGGRRSLDSLAHCLNLAREQGWCRTEWRRFGPAGEEIWDELSFNPVLVAGQSLLHMTWRDTTARRQGEQRLRESEGRLQLALAASGAGVWHWEFGSQQLHQDARSQELAGLIPPTSTNGPPTGSDLPFDHLLQTVHPDDRARVAQALTQAQQTREPFELEHRLVAPGSPVRYVAAAGRFSYDEASGQALRLTGLVRDISARHQATEELNYKNRLLSNVLAHMPVLLARLGPDGRYREHVGHALRRLGLTDNALVGQAAPEVFPHIAPHLARLLAGHSENYRVTLAYHGASVSLQCYGFFDTERQEAVVFALDITDSEVFKDETTRLQLRQQQEVLSAILSTQEEERRRIAEALHNGVGQLLYGTRLHLDGLPPSEAVRASKELLNEAIRATRTISFELTPSILEDFGLAVALQELVGRIPSSLAVDLSLRGLDQPLPPLLATAVYRIVQELLNNVMKHAQAQEVFVQVGQAEGQVHVSVEDNGVGFDIDGPASRVGIGLAGMRTRVGLLGGTFSGKSQPGRGTGFFLQIPVPGH